MIKSIQFTDEEQTQILVTTDDNQVISTPLDGSVWIHEYVREWCLTNVIEPYKKEIATTISVTPRQAKLALLEIGLLDDVEAAITAAGRAAQIEWENALSFERTNPLLSSLCNSLGLTSEQLDGLFVTASSL